MEPTEGPVADGRDKGDGKRPRRRNPRPAVERVFLRVVATVGIVGIGVGLGAILASNKVQGWIIGLVIAVVTVVMTGLLSSNRQIGGRRD